METPFPSTPFLFPLLLLFLLFLVLIKKLISKAAKLPPSPWRLPIVGHIHHLLGSLPHHALYKLAQRHGPLMYLRLGQVDHFVVSSAEVAKEFLRTYDTNFADRPELLVSSIILYGNKDIAFAPYGSYWRYLRKICLMELLSPRRVKSFGSLREDEISNLMSFISLSGGRSPVSLTRGLSNFTNTMTSRAAFGTRCIHAQKFVSFVKTATELGSGFSIADLFPSLGFIDVLSGLTSRLKKAHRNADEILDEILQEHEEKRDSRAEGEHEEEDLVDVLLGLKENSTQLDFPFTNLNIKAVILDVFAAGTETTSSVLGWAMAELMKHPELMSKAQAEVRRVLKGKAKIQDGDMDELHYMKMVIKETLRLHPPIPMLLPRVCRETCEVMGYEIRKGSRVFINVWAIARDPSLWKDPESFRPERFDGSSVDYKGGNFALLPFGSGKRICLGITFGMANVELALANLLFHFDWELPHGMKKEEQDMKESFGASMSRKEELRLIATPFAPN